MIYKSFYAVLNSVLEINDTYLPLSPMSEAEFKALVPENESMILDISDGFRQEAVVATNNCDTITIERGDNPHKFPRGSDVKFCLTPGMLAVIKNLICTFDCCETPCPCEPVKSAGNAILPKATSGSPWAGSFVFTGDNPMNLAVYGAPSWASVIYGPNFVRLEGTGTGAGTWNISVAATNCSGSVAIQQGTLVLED